MAVDGHAGVVVVALQARLRHDVEIVTGEERDTGQFGERPDIIEETLGAATERIMADAAHGVSRIHAALEDRRIEAVIPPMRAPRRKRSQGFPTERF